MVLYDTECRLGTDTFHRRGNPMGCRTRRYGHGHPSCKLYEELLIGDSPKSTSHPRIMKAHEDFITLASLTPRLVDLETALNINEVNAIRLLMKQLVSGYTPDGEIVDGVYMEQEAKIEAHNLESSDLKYR